MLEQQYLWFNDLPNGQKPVSGGKVPQNLFVKHSFCQWWRRSEIYMQISFLNIELHLCINIHSLITCYARQCWYSCFSILCYPWCFWSVLMFFFSISLGQSVKIFFFWHPSLPFSLAFSSHYQFCLLMAHPINFGNFFLTILTPFCCSETSLQEPLHLFF